MQEGFPVEPLRNNSGASYRYISLMIQVLVSESQSYSANKVRVETRKSELQLPFLQTICRALAPEFPKIAAETAVEAWSAAGSAGNCCRDCPSLEEQRSSGLCSSSPGTPPPHSEFCRSFPSSFRSTLGKFRLQGPVDGRGNVRVTPGQAKSEPNRPKPVPEWSFGSSAERALKAFLNPQRAIKGGGKQNPSPKTFLDPPPSYDTFSPPFFGDFLSFPSKERGADQTNPNC